MGRTATNAPFEDQVTLILRERPQGSCLRINGETAVSSTARKFRRSLPGCPAGVVHEEDLLWCCQMDSNQSPFPANSVNLPGTELPPLGESDGTVELEVLS